MRAARQATFLCLITLELWRKHITGNKNSQPISLRLISPSLSTVSAADKSHDAMTGWRSGCHMMLGWGLLWRLLLLATQLLALLFQQVLKVVGSLHRLVVLLAKLRQRFLLLGDRLLYSAANTHNHLHGRLSVCQWIIISVNSAGVSRVIRYKHQPSYKHRHYHLKCLQGGMQ